jgi:hypothetical protein
MRDEIVPATGAVRQCREPAAGLPKQGEARRGDFARLRPLDGAGRRLRRNNRRTDLFNPKEKFSCRYSADAGRGIALCNSWLRVRRRNQGDERGSRLGSLSRITFGG